MKKIIALLMAGMMTATVFAGCGGSGSGESKADNASKADDASKTESVADGDSDWAYIQSKGKMTIGITYFEPMNYQTESGELTGFETEFSKAVCEELGVEAEFQEIDWDSKEIELNSKKIDCIWNGMTITDERKENMSISVPYMENKQVMVCKKENVEKYSQSVTGANIVAEADSAGEEVCASDAFFGETNYVSVASQATALLEVKAGTADVAVIDYIMSLGTIREDSDYADLATVTEKSFAPEQYGIAFRKGSDTTEKVNEAIQKVADSGKLKEISDKYNLTDMVLVKAAS